MDFYSSFPRVSVAYSVDASGNKYFGEAPSGTKSDKPGWQICRMTLIGGTVNWIMHYPVDPATNRASSSSVFVWNSATDATYTYRELGT